MNCFTTFAAESGRRVSRRTYVGFLVTGLAGLMAGTFALLVAIAAKLLAIAASFACNFSLAHFIIFGRVKGSGVDPLRLGQSVNYEC